MNFTYNTANKILDWFFSATPVEGWVEDNNLKKELPINRQKKIDEPDR
jgi:hypothetical protein